jgi:hypothetical protein
VLTSLVIRSQIDALEDDETDAEDISDIQDLHEVGTGTSGAFGNVFLGAVQPPLAVTFRALEQSCQDNPAFSCFRIRFATFLENLLRRSDSPIHLDPQQRVIITADDYVSRHHASDILH